MLPLHSRSVAPCTTPSGVALPGACMHRSTTFPEECTVTSTSLPDSLIRHPARPVLHGSGRSSPQEQERIFEQMWFCAARVQRPGQARAPSGRSTVGRESILLTRDRRDDAPRLLQRLPPPRRQAVHRGVRARCKRAFQCPYHAWTYDLDGKLVAAPNLTKMPDVDRTEYGLVDRRASASGSATSGSASRTSPPSVRGHRGRRGGRAARRPRVDRALRHGQPAGRPADRLRRQGQLEAHRRELHGVLPLRDHPPRADRGAARVRRRLRGAVLRRTRRRVRRRRQGVHRRRLRGAGPASRASAPSRTAATTRSRSSRRSSSTWCPTT